MFSSLSYIFLQKKKKISFLYMQMLITQEQYIKHKLIQSSPFELLATTYFPITSNTSIILKGGYGKKARYEQLGGLYIPNTRLYTVFLQAFLNAFQSSLGFVDSMAPMKV